MRNKVAKRLRRDAFDIADALQRDEWFGIDESMETEMRKIYKDLKKQYKKGRKA